MLAKSLGPLKRRVNHLNNLDLATDDTKVFSQSTSYKDKVFLTIKKELQMVCKLVTGDASVAEFVNSRGKKSENEMLLVGPPPT